MLQVLHLYHTEETPTCGLAMSSSKRPTPQSTTWEVTCDLGSMIGELYLLRFTSTSVGVSMVMEVQTNRARGGELDLREVGEKCGLHCECGCNRGRAEGGIQDFLKLREKEIKKKIKIRSEREPIRIHFEDIVFSHSASIFQEPMS